MTVGLREVKEKRKRWREHKSEKKRAELLGKHMIPVVLGPDDGWPTSGRPAREAKAPGPPDRGQKYFRSTAYVCRPSDLARRTRA